MAKKASPSHSINFIISHACNIKCRSCINDDAQLDHRRLPLETALKVVDNAAALTRVKSIHFSGGEPFLHFDWMRSVARHAYDRHEISSGVTTNGYWATSERTAREKLELLYQDGLRALGLSIDEYHEEFIELSKIRNVLTAAKELNILTRIQAAVAMGTKRIEDYRRELQVEAEAFRWQNIACMPLGYAARKIDRSEIFTKKGIPARDCTMGRYITVYPDGGVGLCGTSRQSPALTFGNVNKQPLEQVLQYAERTPLFNAITLWWGPRLLGEMLADKGEPRFRDGSYSHVCHACYSILEDKAALELLSSAFPELASDLMKEKAKASREIRAIKLHPSWVVSRAVKR